MRTRKLLSGVMTIFVCAISTITINVPAKGNALTLFANRGAVDSDGDSVPDLTDNAPGIANASQADSDGDLIGDAIDPTPGVSGPFISGAVLNLSGPYFVSVGGPLSVNYNMSVAPAGAFGHIDLNFDGGAMDATYFGPMDTTLRSFAVPANFFTSANWNLGRNGAYALAGSFTGPSGSTPTVTSAVSAIPEPMSLWLLLPVMAGMFIRGRR